MATKVLLTTKHIPWITFHEFHAAQHKSINDMDWVAIYIDKQRNKYENGKINYKYRQNGLVI